LIVIFLKDRKRISDISVKWHHCPFPGFEGHEAPLCPAEILFVKPHDIRKTLPGKTSQGKKVLNVFQPGISFKIMVYDFEKFHLSQVNYFIIGFFLIFVFAPENASLDLISPSSKHHSRKELRVEEYLKMVS
jgi:hypothetical protein